jgi:hypothetical protein
MGYAMREFDSQHAADRDDSGADAHPGRASGERQARYEGGRDPEARRAGALEYRQRVDAVYAAYSATHAPPQDAGGKHAVEPGTERDGMRQGAASAGGRTAMPGSRGHAGPGGKPGSSHFSGDAAADRAQDPVEAAAANADSGEQPAGLAAHGSPDSIGIAGPGRRPGAAASELTCAETPARGDAPSGTLNAEHPVHADDDRPQLPPAGRDGPQRGTRAAEPEGSWPPPEGDQERVRKLYGEYLADRTRTGRGNGRDQGTDTVGSTPDRSPGDISGLPPAGDELTEMESSKGSRFAELVREAEKEENLDDLHDALQENANTIQKWLSARPPQGHAEQPVPTHHPHVIPWVPEHGIDGGSAASAVLAAGILTIHMAHWIDGKLRHGKDDHDVSHR